MARFNTVTELSRYIVNHHISFGGEGGYGFLSDVRDILILVKSAFDDPALETVNYEAWMDIQGYGELHTLACIGFDTRTGIWSITECPYDKAYELGLI